MRANVNEERNKLMKVRVDYQGNNQWQLRPETTKNSKPVSKGKRIFRGGDEEFRKFLMKCKVADTDSEPSSKRNKRYADIVQDMKANKRTYVWMYSKNWSKANTIESNGGSGMKHMKERTNLNEEKWVSVNPDTGKKRKEFSSKKDAEDWMAYQLDVQGKEESDEIMSYREWDKNYRPYYESGDDEYMESKSTKRKQKMKEGPGAGVKFTFSGFLQGKGQRMVKLVYEKHDDNGWELIEDTSSDWVPYVADVELESYMDRAELRDTPIEVQFDISDGVENLLSDLERDYNFEPGDKVSFQPSGYIEELNYMYGRGYARFDAPNVLHFDGDRADRAELEVEIFSEKMRSGAEADTTVGDISIRIGDELKDAYEDLDSVEDNEYMESKSTKRKQKPETITIPEEFRIPGSNVILEEGDKITILNENMVGGVEYDEDDPTDPAPDDYVIRSDGFKLHVGEVEGRFIGTFVDFDEAADAIKDRMDREGFYPQVWFEDDHGGIEPINI